MMDNALSTTADNVYALRMSRLLHKPFREWNAFKEGVIDELGNVIKKPESQKERVAWTKFHVVARNLKRMIQTAPGGSSALKIGASYILLKEIRDEHGLSDLFIEAVVSGDAGGNPSDIAQGINSGAVTYPGAGGTMGKKKKKTPD